MTSLTDAQIQKIFIRAENIRRDFFDGKVRDIVEKYFGRHIPDMHGAGIKIEVYKNTYTILLGKKELGSFEYELKY